MGTNTFFAGVENVFEAVGFLFDPVPRNGKEQKTIGKKHMKGHMNGDGHDDDGDDYNDYDDYESDLDESQFPIRDITIVRPKRHPRTHSLERPTRERMHSAAQSTESEWTDHEFKKIASFGPFVLAKSTKNMTKVPPRTEPKVDRRHSPPRTDPKVVRRHSHVSDKDMSASNGTGRVKETTLQEQKIKTTRGRSARSKSRDRNGIARSKSRDRNSSARSKSRDRSRSRPNRLTKARSRSRSTHRPRRRSSSRGRRRLPAKVQHEPKKSVRKVEGKAKSSTTNISNAKKGLAEKRPVAPPPKVIVDPLDTSRSSSDGKHHKEDAEGRIGQKSKKKGFFPFKWRAGKDDKARLVSSNVPILTPDSVGGLEPPTQVQVAQQNRRKWQPYTADEIKNQLKSLEEGRDPYEAGRFTPRLSATESSLLGEIMDERDEPQPVGSGIPEQTGIVDVTTMDQGPQSLLATLHTKSPKPESELITSGGLPKEEQGFTTFVLRQLTDVSTIFAKSTGALAMSPSGQESIQQGNSPGPNPFKRVHREEAWMDQLEEAESLDDDDDPDEDKYNIMNDRYNNFFEEGIQGDAPAPNVRRWKWNELGDE